MSKTLPVTTIRDCLTAVLVIALFFAASSGQAQPMASESETMLLLDNDEFAGINRKDRWYTSGAKVSRIRQADLSNDGWTARAIDSGCIGVSGRPRNYTSAWSLGQNLYTQNVRTREVARPDDRPVGAYLYGSYHEYRGTVSHSGALTYELGITGPAALGEFVQNNLHDLLGRARVPAWRFQLRPRLSLNLHLGCTQRWLAGPGTLMTGYTVSAGNSLVQASLSLGLALGPGRNTVEFIREARLAQPTIHSRRGWAMLIGARARMVAHDALIDGDTFGYDSTVSSRPLVGEFFLGLQLDLTRNWQIQASWIQRTMEFEGPGVAAQNYEPQRFGGIRIRGAF